MFWLEMAWIVFFHATKWNAVISIALVFVVVFSGPSRSLSVQDEGALYKTDLCLNDGYEIQCGPHEVVQLHSVTCSNSNRYSVCAPELNATLFTSCDGRQSCAGLGLQNIFDIHCSGQSLRNRGVTVKFLCEKDNKPMPPCRTNICSKRSKGLSCPADSVLHIHNLTCLTGLEPCSWATYVTLYTLCEGRRDCDSSGLRMLMPTYCNGSMPELRNVFVDYLCVPKRLVYTQCTGQHTPLKEPFGLLMNPGFIGRVTETDMQCNWYVTPENASRIVHVIAHVAYSKWATLNCSSGFLEVRYRDCSTHDFRSSHFCDLSQVNTHMTSCGPVHISSWLPAVSDQADRFLVSYSIVSNGSGDVTPGNMAACTAPLVTTTPPPPFTYQTSAPVAGISSGRNYGPSGRMFDYTDTIRHTAGDDSPEGHPIQISLQLKLIILYIFFGTVILALIIALVYVLVSYRGISPRRKLQGDNSEKAALWRHDETPLDTFNHNSHNSLADAHNSAAPDSSRSDTARNSADSLVVATVHAESTDDEENRFSCGSRFSSFLKGEDLHHPDIWANLPTYATVDNAAFNDHGHGGEGRDTTTDNVSDDTGRPTYNFNNLHAGSGSNRNSNLSHGSFRTNSEFGDIYESIDTHDQHYDNPHPVRRQGDVDYYSEFPEEHHPLLDGLPVSGPPPPSPPLPPPPPPLAETLDATGLDSSAVDHYVVNDDEYAVVRKAKPRPTGSRPESSYYTNLPCLLKNRDENGGVDAPYDNVETYFVDDVPAPDFRPTSGPYDRDRNSKCDQNISPKTGTSRHRWDVDL